MVLAYCMDIKEQAMQATIPSSKSSSLDRNIFNDKFTATGLVFYDYFMAFTQFVLDKIDSFFQIRNIYFCHVIHAFDYLA